MKNKKHLTFSDRNRIQGGLVNKKSFNQIAKELGKSPSTISREVKLHKYYERKGAKWSRFFNDCMYRKVCKKKYVCDDENCIKEHCGLCGKCIYICDIYKKEVCERREKPPYVCNGCPIRSRCQLEKCFYDSVYAQKQYEEVLCSTRNGIATSESEQQYLNDLICPLLKKGQSLHHIYVNNKDTILVDERTLYNYIHQGAFDITNLEMPRLVRYKKRVNTNHYKLKVDKGCYHNRNYQDYQQYMKEHSDVAVVQIDSVEGKRDESQAILTIHFLACSLQLGFFRKHNDAKSVIDIFNNLYKILGPETFKKLFPVILADRGSEFSSPKSIEFDKEGNERTKVFFCDPMCSWQKGGCENNHEFIRYYIPKGESIAFLTQEKVDLMMNHINNFTRKKLGDNTPYSIFKFMYGVDILEKLGIFYIAANNVIRKPSLIR